MCHEFGGGILALFVFVAIVLACPASTTMGGNSVLHEKIRMLPRVVIPYVDVCRVFLVVLVTGSLPAGRWAERCVVVVNDRLIV